MDEIIKPNEVDLRLIIIDFEDITHDDITLMTGVKPTYIRTKGQPRNPKQVDSPLWPNNLWSMNSGLGVHASFEDQMNRLLDIIENNIEVFNNLCSKYYCEFACALMVYKDNGESTPSVHLDERYNQVVKTLNIEFDIDLYVF
ncbi:DUF4279 domain-containing protein [Mucilaginibacter sp. 14171R-50]|uniref:DUF4279 domain-containing protein n=1 Tax=Mucilaginibacter sp. 14171R-50 TaxID=2703789 RepID=UPI00138DB162|nr:DUF4279 domain-containing protein [Mucilaginibacter sp. 14171R-50]QHS54488.1 DUF4279 domain-containing protein [Mucilaginibacter sp. 14171R-50]